MLAITEDTTLSTTIIFLFYTINFFLYLFFQLIKSSPHDHDENRVATTSKKLSKPFVGSVECHANLTTELMKLSFIMTLTYICENHWIFDHSAKEYSRDLFFFVVLLFFLNAIYTIHPNKDLSLLGRAQTEEWKGWMQFIFLLYHYFHAEEVYNSVRVMITCYVWMTGFGNFSYFYIKQDFGWLRVVQMMWRLNFSVFFLMMTHGNTYILYYICPLHTFYFLMVYVTMYLGNGYNHSKWGARVKLLILAIVIYLVWDTSGSVFATLFGWLSTEPTIGASSGTQWEWYFRSSLDHWSTFFGMIFALNFPLCEQYFKIATGWPITIAGVIMGLATIWWLCTIYVKEKVEYNQVHSYFAIIPLTSYIFFRNLTPFLRSGVSMSLHELGKTTLETYLLQHHVWLTSNAKTLLTIVPNHPWINFMLASVMFYYLSRELYRLTMSLRGMLLPESKSHTLWNMGGIVVIFGVLTLIAIVLHNIQGSVMDVIAVSLLAAAGVAGVVGHISSDVGRSEKYKHWKHRYIGVCVVAAVLCFTLRGFGSSEQVESTPVTSRRCDFNTITTGGWIERDCSSHPASAICSSHDWQWYDTSSCGQHHLSDIEARAKFTNKKISFIGDSGARNAYYEFCSMLDPSLTFNRSDTIKHANIVREIKSANIEINFVWAPYSIDVVSYVRSVFSSNHVIAPQDVVVLSSTLWDALHTRDIAKYTSNISNITGTITAAGKQRDVYWLEQTKIINEKLLTPEKRQYMTEEIVSKYRDAANQLMQQAGVSVVYTADACRGQENACLDGIHYAEDVYAVIAQMLGNLWVVKNPVVSRAPTPAPKEIGVMSSPVYGALLLGLAAIMLFGMDSLLGIGLLSLVMFKRSYNWNEAYEPLLRKLGKIGSPRQADDVEQAESELVPLKSDEENGDAANK